MTQSELPFVVHPARTPARARRTDPATSHAAADRAESSGLVRGHCEAIVRLVVAHPGRSARALAALPECRLDHVQIDRRAKELETGGWLEARILESPTGLLLFPTEKARAFVRAAAEGA